MALKFLITKEERDALPEALQAAYVEDKENAGRFKLDADDAGTRAQLKEFRENNIKLLKKQEELEAFVKKFTDLGDFDPEAYKKAMATEKLLQEKKLIDEGKLEEVVGLRSAEMRKAHEAQVKAFETQLAEQKAKADAATSQLSSILIDNEVTQSVSKVGSVRQGAMADVLARARGTFQLKDGTPVALDSDGNIVYSATDATQPMPISEWAGKLAKEAPHLFEGTSGAGGKGGAGNGGASGSIIDSTDKAAISANLEAIANGKMTVRMPAVG